MIIPTIEFVLEAMAAEDFPTLEKVKQFLELLFDLSFGAKVPHNATAKRSVKLQEASDNDQINISTNTGQVTNIDEYRINNINQYNNHHMDDDNAKKFKSIYGLNNATTDVPMEQDLNCNNTVKSIVLHYIGLKDWCLSDTFGCDITAEFENNVSREDTVEREMLLNPILEKEHPWAAAGWGKNDWPTPWMTILGPILCGDDQPTFGMLLLQELDT